MGPRRRRRRRHGGNIFSSINDFLKKHRIISTVGKALGSAGLPYVGAIGNAAKILGYGKRKRVGVRRRRLVEGRRRVYHRRRGGDLESILSGAHNFIKSNRLVSKGLRALGHPKLAAASHSLGYGKRRVRRVRRGYGGANYFSTEMLAVPKF